MGFRENLKEELKYKDIKVKELSAMTGIPKGTIDHYLAEKSTVPLADAAVKIANALGVTTEYLVMGSDKSNIAYKEISCENLKSKVRDIAGKINNMKDSDIEIIKTIVERLEGN